MPTAGLNPNVFNPANTPRPTPNMPNPQPAPFDYANQTPSFLGSGTYQVNPGAFDIPGANFYQSFISNQLGQNGQPGVANRPAPQLDGSQQEQFRAGQMDLASALAAQANGTGPSVAQGQFQHATDTNLAQALAMAQAAGPNNAGAARNVAYQRGDISQQAAGDSAQLRLQEQMQARNQLGQVLAGARGQDLGLAGDNAQLQGQQNALNDQAVRAYMSMGLTLAQAQAQAQQDLEKLRMGSFYASAGNEIGGKILGGVLSAGGAFAGGYASGMGGG
jgi:hypothetical protein